MSLLRRLAMAGCILPLGIGMATARETPALSDVFVLGKIILHSVRSDQGGTGSTVSPDTILRTNRQMLDDALSVVPGVIAGNSGGSRNERLLFVRGFDRFQVPLSIDGIRVYLPADNRLDFGRFLTPDLAEIQVQKGYVSVLNGPGGMGGAINLVTRQPTKAFEGEARLGLEAGNTGAITGRTGYLSLGTKQELFFVQGSYLKRSSDGYYLSRDFVPTPVQAAGLRGYSDTEDSRLNLKFGYTPNDTDEYVLSFTRQTGAKNAPYNVDQPVRGITPTPLPPGSSYQRDWSWPVWDIDSLAFYSHTEFSEGLYLNTKAYYNTFDNTLSAWDNYTHSTQTVNRAFDSIYDDKALGLSAEIGGNLSATDVLKGSLHFRRDEHSATNIPRPGVNTTPDPAKVSKEETYSFALENTWHARDDLSIVAGLSFDKAKVLMADRTETAPGYPTGSTEAVNWQVAAIWEPDGAGTYHASLSSRTRFPTLFNRYSTRFGTAVPNPDLKSERALNFELGYDGDLGPAHVQTAIFYSNISDMMQSVPVGTGLTQTQNVGDGKYAGFEIAGDWELSPTLALSASYTYLHREIAEPVRAGLKATDTPMHSAALRLDWQATDRLKIAPSLQLSSSRLSDAAIQPTDPTQVAYTKNAGFGVANLDVEWQVTDKASVIFGVRNIFDKNYELVEGFPEAGRSFYLTTGLTF